MAVYPDNFEQKLGVDRLRRQLSELCATQAAERRIEQQQFTPSREEVEWRLSLTEQMCQMLYGGGGFPLSDAVEIDDLVAKIGVEGLFLEPEELVLLRIALTSVAEIVGWVRHQPEQSYPAIERLMRDVEAMPELLRLIDGIIDRVGVVRDSASPELADIRRQIRQTEGSVAKRLQNILTSAKSAGIVESDASISIRDGRAVIPVVAGNKRKLQGLVQDESASGKTVYIEPIEIVEMNNELRELEHSQRREIVRILTAFTSALRPYADELSRSGDFLVEVDMLKAKARWSHSNGCVRPILSQEGILSLRSARHPILNQTLVAQGKSIVPLDLTLDAKSRMLVISGPNAGGKSVCLKTVGLLQYMLQCGFLVPVSENSEFPLFDNIFIDIGDQQSIENDLSTYSSHLLNMKNMLSDASPSTLLLVDEFGSGTEPIIGGAIAESILERFVERGSYGVITTHYANIKYFASNNEGVVNGAMMFDVKNIVPLFKLEMGKPGSSFAVEIARKIGLPEQVIHSAMDKAGSDHINIEKQLREIARDKRYWEVKRDKIRLADRRLEQTEQSYAERLAKVREERNAILADAKRDAKRLVDEANRQIEQTIKTIRESEAERDTTRLARRNLESFKTTVERGDAPSQWSGVDVEREIERLNERAERRAERRAQQAAAPTTTEPAPTTTLPLGIGSNVRIEGQEALGQVQSIKGAWAQVAFGAMLIRVDKSRLEVVSNAEAKRVVRSQSPTSSVVGQSISQRKLEFRGTLDVRGQRVVDALDEVRDFIDDAVMVGIESVTILHGKGTGALKDEIRRYLRTVNQVQTVRDQHADMGGSGITVVEFKV